MSDVYKKNDSLGDSFTLRLLFAEWTRVCKHSMSNRDICIQFAERVKYIS